MTGDLAPDALAAALPGHPLRAYPALVSTDAAARAWARAGAPGGAVVVADYQASARGRGGLPWRVEPGRDLGLSVVLRPALEAPREGWLYTLATAALAAATGDGATVAWPDEVRVRGARAGAVAVHAELGAEGVAWAVMSVLAPAVEGARAELLGRFLAALDERAGAPAERVLAEHRERCETLGRRVSATLLPLGPRARSVAGTAVSTRDDGALVVATDAGARVAVLPQGVGPIEVA